MWKRLIRGNFQCGRDLHLRGSLLELKSHCIEMDELNNIQVRNTQHLFALEFLVEYGMMFCCVVNL